MPASLLDNLRAVEAETELHGDNEIAAQRGGDRHTAKAADGAGDIDADYRRVAAQIDNRRVKISAMAARPGLASCRRTPPVSRHSTACVRDTVAIIFRRQLQRGGRWRRTLRPYCRPEGASMAITTAGWPLIDAFGDHHTVIGLRDSDALGAEPRRHNAVKRIQQFAVAAVVQRGVGAFAKARSSIQALRSLRAQGGLLEKPVQYEYGRRPAWRRSRG